MRVCKIVLHGIVSAMVITQSRTQYSNSENVRFWESLTSGVSAPKTRRNNNHFWERLTHSDAFWNGLEHSPRQIIAQKSEHRPKRQNKRQTIRKPKIGKRQTLRTKSPQVLMTECPLKTRCVSRNFCDNNGMMTSSKHNDFTFEDDKRGFIACVDSGRNVLGVCCVDLVIMLSGQGRPVRQDDVFTVESSIDLDEPRKSLAQADDDLGPFVIINIAADNANIDGSVRDNKRVKTNTKTRHKVTPSPRPSVPPDFLADNPFIGGDDDVSLTPSDVMTILNIMNNNRNQNNNNVNNNNNNFNSNQPVFTTCPAATLCVDRNRCDFNGVITSSSIPFNPRLASMQVALDKCTTTGVTRPRRQSEDKVCCRDPNKIRKDYDDEDDYVSNYDFDDDMFNIDYEDFDQVNVYNMKTPSYKDLQKDKSVTEKLRKKSRRKKKKRPSQRLQAPKTGNSRGNRDSLDFFTNG